MDYEEGCWVLVPKRSVVDRATVDLYGFVSSCVDPSSSCNLSKC